MLRRESSFGKEIEKVAEQIVDSAYKIHKAFGPGLLESAYEACMKHELNNRGLDVVSQIPMPIIYDGVMIESGFRIDLLVNDAIIVELKAVDTLLPVHKAQLLTYMKLNKKRPGFLLNFNVPLMKRGVVRLVV